MGGLLTAIDFILEPDFHYTYRLPHKPIAAQEIGEDYGAGDCVASGLEVEMNEAALVVVLMRPLPSIKALSRVSVASFVGEVITIA